MAELRAFSTGSRVIRPSARPVDFAFNKTGTVCREHEDGKDRIGVLWDGAWSIFEYPPEMEFDAAELEEAV